MNNLLLIDSRVPDIATLKASVNETTTCIEFNTKTDTLNTLVSKITGTFECIGIVQHNYGGHKYSLVSSMVGGLLKNVEKKDKDLNTWSNFKILIRHLKTNNGLKHLDMMACAIYSNPNWKYVLDKLEKDLDVDIRSSKDDTGSKDNANWFLESDGINLRDVYFTDKISEYKGVLSSVEAYHFGVISTIKNRGIVWGCGSYGQLSINDDSHQYAARSMIVDSKPLENVKQIAIARYHTVVLLNNGSVLVCGENEFGQLGLGVDTDGNYDDSDVLELVPARLGKSNTGPLLTGVKYVATAGDDDEDFANTAVVMEKDGSVLICGSNYDGQLCAGMNASYYNRGYFSKVRVNDPKNPGSTIPLKNVNKVVFGYEAIFFLMNNKTVLAAGSNNNGKLGIGYNDEEDVFFPTPVVLYDGNIELTNNFNTNGTPLTNVKDISAGYDHTLFLMEDGSVMACGANYDGQLGNTNIDNDETEYPVPVLTSVDGPILTGVTAISAGAYHSVFLMNTTRVMACGDNDHGELGNNTYDGQDYPVYIQSGDGVETPITNIKRISTSARNTYLLAKSGRVYSTGDNGHGQLGNNDDNVDERNYMGVVVYRSGRPIRAKSLAK
jgi:alpha-tubulin suppressor-like RCC1 family protein